MSETSRLVIFAAIVAVAVAACFFAGILANVR